jgi:two-component system phosphate regulon sensor histidine kinase PhoR
MPSHHSERTRTPHDPRRSELRRIVILVSVFVVGPALLLLSVGVLVLAFGSVPRDYLFGVLILGLVVALMGGSAATFVCLKREANLAKLQTDFVSKVSHDLRTPLTSIRMFVETLQLGRAKSQRMNQQCLDVIATESARLSAMIDRLLGWARMEAGKRSYRAELCRPTDIVAAAIAAFEAQCLSHPVQLELDLPPELPSVFVDKDSMVEALLNLLQNAHRYTGDDKRIQVRCRYEPRAAKLGIFIDDNGPGIPKREQHRIFEMFYRAEDPLKRDLAGTGLGLAIVQHIVRGNGGSVSVESEVGHGSSFRVLLPTAEATGS